MSEEKVKKARGPRKTPLQRMEADRDRYAKELDAARARLAQTTADHSAAYGACQAAESAWRAMDAAVNAQTQPRCEPDTTSAPLEMGKTRGEVRS